MQPKPWSHSALESHDNCAFQFYRTRVKKDIVEEKSAQQEWGLKVHKSFEDYLCIKPKTIGEMAQGKSGFVLPYDLEIHKPYLDGLLQKPGILYAEQKVALGRNPFGTCGYFENARVWWRGVIDCMVLDTEQGVATIADFKTGREHDKWDQLAMSAVYTFFAHPKIELVNAQFYWTETQRVTKKVWGRSEIDSLVGMFAPKLQAYVTSFKTETWTPKQSGLCRGWCPVKDCKFWEPKREKRG